MSKRLKVSKEETISPHKKDNARSRQAKGRAERKALGQIETNSALKPERNSPHEESQAGFIKQARSRMPLPKKHMMKSDSSDEEDDIAEYAKLRQRNLKENKEFLAQLGMNQAKSELMELTLRHASARGYKQKRDTHVEVLPRRQPSLRLQRKDPLEEDIQYFPPVQPERKVGSLEFHEVLKNKEDMEESGKHFISYLQKMKQKNTRPEPLPSDLDRYVKGLDKLELTEDRVAKVCPGRIFSLSFHPTTEKTLLAAGDKWGNVGFWDVTGQDGVFCFAPHVRPVRSLAFSPFNSSHLYTSSDDGSLRRGDLTKAVFEEVYVYPDKEDNVCPVAFAFFTLDTLVASTSDGYVVFIDRRTASLKGESEYLVHERRKKVRTVSIHPIDKQYFATAGGDRCVKIWDSRKMSQGKNLSPVCELTQDRTVNSAYFSSVTGNKLLTTSMDNSLRMYHTATIDNTIQSTWIVRHKQSFKLWSSYSLSATWHPARDDLFVVGSMDKTRRIKVFSGQGTVVKTYGDSEWLGSVCLLNAFHPSQDIVAGANEVGRVHVFI